ncbi:sulfatase-like hydrolase/transferase [Halosquirtibacter xylanolyticus]|uniref:sulfatase family protein n=1 Tax=Halosquirtibacter xylanolyticus TaxID=3374599 RepID=UPI003749AF78|nr:sulfatase-like hydrolase/transferase [Prolixibacteraceae bacterium]
MNRRNFLKQAGVVAGVTTVATTGGLVSCKKRQQKRPNILVIMTDQQTADAMSCVDSKLFKTPAMDRIVEAGKLIKKAYCSTPLCIPSRSSMFTGLYPHEINVAINDPGAQWDKDKFPYLGRIMKAGGYDTGYVGKWHLTTDPKDISKHGFDYIKHARNNDLDPDVPASTISFLEKERDKPFMLVSSFVNPHDICQWARGDAMRNDEIPNVPSPKDCPELPSNFEIPALEPEMIRTQQLLSSRTYPTVSWDDDRWRQYRWAYAQLVEKVDQHIQKIVDALDQLSLWDDTVIFFTSDHGDGNGCHKWNQKQVLYDEVARVPFSVTWKGNITPGTIETTAVSSGIDLIPTILDYAQIDQPNYMKGSSVRALVEDKSSDFRKYTVVETDFCNMTKRFGVRGRAVISGNYKLIIYDVGKVRLQLFDMSKDPGEMTNLAYLPENRAVVDEYLEYLKEWKVQTKDDFDFVFTDLA